MKMLIVTIGCVIWDKVIGWRGWSVDFALPSACILIQLSMLIISWIYSHSPREYMIYYVMASVYSILVPFFLLIAGVVKYQVPSVLCVGCSFLFLLGLILFRKKEFHEEMYKKFHV